MSCFLRQVGHARRLLEATHDPSTRTRPISVRLARPLHLRQLLATLSLFIDFVRLRLR